MLWRYRRTELGAMIAFVGFCLTAIGVSAQTVTPNDPGIPWATVFTLPNVIATGTLVFHFGMYRQQMKDFERRFQSLEDWRSRETERYAK